MSPISCIVACCTKIGTLSFPKDESLRLEWIKAIEHIKPGFKIQNHSRICSDHFKQSDFSRSTLSLLQADTARKRLKKTAVPSIFPWLKSSKSSHDEDNEAIHVRNASSSTSKDQVSFNNKDLLKTYAGVPPIRFVQEQMNVIYDNIEDDLADPLKLSNENSECKLNNEQDNVEVSLNYLENDVLEDTNFVSLEINVVNELEIPSQGVFEAKLPDSIEESVQTDGDKGILGFSLHYYKDNDKAMHMYTGLESFKKFMLVFNTLGQCVYKLNYFYDLPPKHLDPLEQFFITLLILRRHESLEFTATMYHVPVKQIYNIFITWIRFMSLQWRNLDLWVPKQHIKENMPFGFCDKYPQTRVIIDATECPIKKPKLPFAQQVTFSSYKNKNTIKFLVGITPNGFISYISPSYAGSATDRQIIERSTILNRFNYNDEIMVDKGLNVQDIFLPYGVKVNMPAFFKKGSQINPETLKTTRRVASKRVHVERVIGLLKTYKILDRPMNHTETMLSSDIIFVCSMLVNFRSGIINKFA